MGPIVNRPWLELEIGPLMVGRWSSIPGNSEALKSRRLQGLLVNRGNLEAILQFGELSLQGTGFPVIETLPGVWTMVQC